MHDQPISEQSSELLQPRPGVNPVARFLKEEDGAVLLERQLDAPAEQVLTLDVPAAEPPFWTVLPVVLGVLASLWWLRPWSATRTGDGWVLLHVLLLHGAFWATQPVFLTPDSAGYPDDFASFWNYGFTGYFPVGYGMVVAAADALPIPGQALRVTLLQVVLFDKRHDHKVEGFTPDLVGLEVEDHYLFGWGMDYAGYFRHLPDVYALRLEETE